MEGWLGNNISKKIKLKKKKKNQQKKDWATIKKIESNEIEEIDEINNQIYENPFKTKIILP